MSGANYTDLQTIGGLQEIYDPETVAQMNVLSNAYNFIREGDDGEVQIDGLGLNVELQYALNESFSASTDGERLPDSGRPESIFARFNTKLNYASMELTTFAATRGYAGGRNDGKYIDTTLKSTLLSMNLNASAGVLGNGRGLRGYVQTATPTQTSFTVTFTGRIRPTMILDWYDSTLTVKRGTIRVAAKGLDPQSRTVFIDTTIYSMAVPTGAVAGDVLVAVNSLAAGEPSDGRDVSGLARATDNSVSLGQVSPATYAWWRATNVNANLQNPNELILQQHFDNIFAITAMYPNKWIFSQDWKRAYLAGFFGKRQFTTNNYDGGASSLGFSAVQMGTNEAGKKPVALDKCEDYMMDPSEYFLFADQAVFKSSDFKKGIHIADEDNTEFRFIQPFDAQGGFTRNWYQLIYKHRRAIGRGYGFATVAGGT